MKKLNRNQLRSLLREMMDAGGGIEPRGRMGSGGMGSGGMGSGGMGSGGRSANPADNYYAWAAEASALLEMSPEELADVYGDEALQSYRDGETPEDFYDYIVTTEEIASEM